jgi:putative endonuclease
LSTSGGPHYVYILRSLRNGRYYVGSSSDPERRLVAHNAGEVRATRYLLPWETVYREQHPDGRSARQREYQIKRMKSRKYIDGLIDSSR